MVDRYTKVLLTVIAVNMTIMVGWGAAKVLVPDVVAGSVQDVRIVDRDLHMDYDHPLHVYIAGQSTHSLAVDIQQVGGYNTGGRLDVDCRNCN